VIFSNELLDAMPVRRLGWDSNSKRWFEWGVTTESEKFVWQRLSVPQQEIISNLRDAGLDFPALANAALPDRFTVEISPGASAWWSQAARTLQCGKLLTIDYGLTGEDFFTPQRKEGTLRAYHRHHASADLLANPGEQDLTAHVNFTHLQRAGEAMGLRTEGLLSQEQFLTRIAKTTWDKGPKLDTWTTARVRQFQTLTHPEHLGRPFQVLLQARVEPLAG
jgi:SAM-dependent MidA family methyltransferase